MISTIPRWILVRNLERQRITDRRFRSPIFGRKAAQAQEKVKYLLGEGMDVSPANIKTHSGDTLL